MGVTIEALMILSILRAPSDLNPYVVSNLPLATSLDSPSFSTEIYIDMIYRYESIFTMSGG